MTTQTSGSSAGNILTETSGKNLPHQNTEDEDTELLSEQQTEYSADIESRSVTKDRTSESATVTSRYCGDGEHIDKTSDDEMSTEVSHKQVTGNMTSSIGEGDKNEAIYSRHSRFNHSMATRYSSDFEPLSTARTVKSVSSLRYSDDFEPTTTNIKTGQSQYTIEYSEDFESMSRAAETSTASIGEGSGVSHSATVSRPETRSQSASTSTSVHDDQTDATDMTQNDVDDTAYSSDLDHSEMQSGAQCSRTYTDSYEETGASSRLSSHQQTDTSHVTDTDRSTRVEESGQSHMAAPRTYSSGSDVKYSDDDDFTEHEEDVDGEEEEEEQKEENENQEEAVEEEEDLEEREAAYEAEVAYVERKLQALKSDPVHRRTPLTPHPPPTPRLPDTKNMQHVEDFCSHKLSLLRKKRQQPSVFSGTIETGDNGGSTLLGNEAVRHEANARCVYLGLEGTRRVDAHGMSSLKVWKLRERHAMEQIKKATKAKVHIPKKCPACREKLAELAEEEFFRAKTAKMLARLMDQKVEKHLLKYSDTVGLIGELVHELPTMQQTPSEIINQLLRPLENRPRAATETTPNPHLKETSTLPTDVPLNPTQVWETYMAPLHNSGWLPMKS